MSGELQRGGSEACFGAAKTGEDNLSAANR